MEKLGVTREDLAVFAAESSADRAAAIERRLAAPLGRIADRLAAPLSKACGQMLRASVDLTADEARAASVGFLPLSAEGSAAALQLRFSLHRGAASARVVRTCDPASRQALAKSLIRAATALARELGDVELRSFDGWRSPGLPPPVDVRDPDFWRELARRLGKDGTALDLGLGWPEARAVLLTLEDLLPAFRSLAPLQRRLA